MFDIGFGELLLVFVIGLIVLGPQRLPVAVKTVVGWVRALRSLAATVQNELARNHDTRQRYLLLGALGATRDPALGARARDYGLTSAVQIGEMRYLYGAQTDEPENRIAMWAWLQAHGLVDEQRRLRFPDAG